jgi:hypothetical protein
MKPLSNKIQLEIKEVSFGVVRSEAIEEHAKIIAVAPDCAPEWKKRIGKTLYFKAWAVDVVTEGENKYYFISSWSEGICAIK